MGRRDFLLAAAVGQKPDLIEALDRNLGPHDQAWVVCGFDDCIHFSQGHCDIYMVHDVPRMVYGNPCNSYKVTI